jgi:hypothetical protein
MYSVSFMFRNSSNSIGLTFKEHKDAVAAHAKWQMDSALMIQIKDDFGQNAVINMQDVAVCTLGDIGKELERQGEIQLLQARTQAKMQSVFRNDPTLKLIGSGV